MNKHKGSTFDDFLEEEGIKSEVEEGAKRKINDELQEALDEMSVEEVIPVEKDMHRNLAVAMKTIEYLLKQLKAK